MAADATGQPATASGLVALPINRRTRLDTVSFGHGTSIYKGDAPSTSDYVFLIGPALTFASAGFAAVAPDYVGLGAGPGPHPWMDVPSETTASLDLLRAARDFVRTRGRQLTRDVYASGFSQGASAALGLARALQSGADPWFRARAVAPISGAYDFRHAQIPALFTPEVHPVLASATPRTCWPPSTATARFAAALAELDSVSTDWTPRMPVRLYYSPGDEEAVNANTDHCHTALAARGVRAPKVDLGVNTTYNGLVHEGSEVLGVPAVTRWFTHLSN